MTERLSAPPFDTSRLAPAAGSRIAIAGGCGEIGRALVTACVAQDLKVAVLDLESSLAAHVPPNETIALPFDATSSDDVDQTFDRLDREWGALDGFVNLVGFTHKRTRLADTDPESWTEIVDGNLNSAFRLTHGALPLLAKGNSPAIVHVASSLGVKSNWGYGAYAASKAGMMSLTRMIAFEYAPDVRANAVAPSAVDTEFLKGGTGREKFSGVSSLVDLDAYAESVPLGRVAVADDIVGPVLFLMGEASRYMTGQVLHINGGMWTP